MLDTLSLLSEGLQVMYQAFQNGEEFPGNKGPTSLGQDAQKVSAHEILDRLGLVKRNATSASTATSPVLPPGAPQYQMNDLLSFQWDELTDQGPPTPPDSSQESAWTRSYPNTSPADPMYPLPHLNNGTPQEGARWEGPNMQLDSLEEYALFPPVPQLPSQKPHPLLQSSQDLTMQRVN